MELNNGKMLEIKGLITLSLDCLRFCVMFFFFLALLKQLKNEMESQNKINMRFSIWIGIVRVQVDISKLESYCDFIFSSLVDAFFFSALFSLFILFNVCSETIEKKVKQLKTFYASIFRLWQKKT